LNYRKIEGGNENAGFCTSFKANVERKMTDAELIQAVRLDIAGELEAIYLYDAMYRRRITSWRRK
jgi:rubrerythrin